MGTIEFKPFTRSEERYHTVKGVFRPSGESTEGELIYQQAIGALGEAREVLRIISLGKLRVAP